MNSKHINKHAKNFRLERDKSWKKSSEKQFHPKTNPISRRI